jgi:hypothetical protein
VCFQDADIRDVVPFFREIEGTDNERIHKPLLDIMLVLPTSKEAEVPKITLTMRYISYWKALQTVAEVTGLDLSVEDGYVWLKYRQKRNN